MAKLFSSPKYVTCIPDKRLVFQSPFYEAKSMDLYLMNFSQMRVAFKLKVTNPSNYVVRPTTGFLEPGHQTEIRIVLKPFAFEPQYSDVYHYFVILAYPANYSFLDSRQFWTRDNFKSSKLQKKRLPVFLHANSRANSALHLPDFPDKEIQSSTIVIGSGRSASEERSTVIGSAARSVSVAGDLPSSAASPPPSNTINISINDNDAAAKVPPTANGEELRVDTASPSIHTYSTLRSRSYMDALNSTEQLDRRSRPTSLGNSPRSPTAHSPKSVANSPKSVTISRCTIQSNQPIKGVNEGHVMHVKALQEWIKRLDDESSTLQKAIDQMNIDGRLDRVGQLTNTMQRRLGRGYPNKIDQEKMELLWDSDYGSKEEDRSLEEVSVKDYL